MLTGGWVAGWLGGDAVKGVVTRNESLFYSQQQSVRYSVKDVDDDDDRSCVLK